MPRVGILGSTRNETNLDLVERWRFLGLDSLAVSPRDALARFQRDDVVIGRLDVRASLDGVEPGLRELTALSRLGVRLVNRPGPIMNAHDKLRTARLLAASGLPHPRTTHVRSGELSTLSPPVVVKPRFGSWGIDVFRCHTRNEIQQTLTALSKRPWFSRRGAIVQELLPPTGYDVRVLVAAGMVVGAEERVAAPGEWRTNISLGGSHRPTAPSPVAASLAVAAVTALGGDFFGVDLMPVRGGYAVLEVNGAIDFDANYSLWNGDVFADAAGALGLRPESIADPSEDCVAVGVPPPACG